MLNIERTSRNRLAWIAIFAATACRSTPAKGPSGVNGVAPTPAAPGLHAVRVNGTVLNYVDTTAAGARIHADPIVLVHGVSGGVASLARFVEAYASERRTIAYSRRWHTPNPAPDDRGAYSPALHAADLEALTDRLGLRQVDLVGFSYGGLVALEFARRNPKRVHALVLMEPAAFGLLPAVAGGDSLLAVVRAEQAVVRRLLERGDSAGALSYYSSLLRGRAGDSTTLARAPEAGRARALRGMAEFRPQMMTDFDEYMPRLTCDNLREVRMPVLLVRGAGTPAAFGVAVEALARCLPQARVVTRPTGQGHGAAVNEDPAGFNRTVLDFLRTTEGRR